MLFSGGLNRYGGDPHYSNVVVLLSGDDYVDRSKLGLTYTMTTGSINTTTKKFGTGSYYFPGTNGNRLVTSYNANLLFNGYDYTIEFWVYPTAWVNGRSTIMGCWYSPSQTGLYGWLCQASATTNQWKFIMNHPGSGVFNSPVEVPFGLTLNTWTHVAYCRVGTSHKVYKDGVLATTVTDSTGVPLVPVASGYTYNNVLTSTNFFIGENQDFQQQPFRGYIDEIRITKGVARYTSNFTLPDAAWLRY